MNGQALWFATVKAYEARDALAAARMAVEAIHDLEDGPESCAMLSTLLSELEGHARALEAYVDQLKGEK